MDESRTAGCEFFFVVVQLASKKVTKYLSLVVWSGIWIPMTVGNGTEESKIARSFDAWAQWQLRTSYCDLCENSLSRSFVLWTNAVSKLWPIWN